MGIRSLARSMREWLTNSVASQPCYWWEWPPSEATIAISARRETAVSIPKRRVERSHARVRS